MITYTIPKRELFFIIDITMIN